MIRFLMILSLLIVSCTKKSAELNRKFETIETSEWQFNLTFPQKLWDKILDNAPLSLNTKKGAYEIFTPLTIEVSIVELKGSPLGGKNYKLNFEQFGADLDWNNYIVRGQGGIFKLYFRIQDIQKDETLKVYFLGWTDQIEVNSEKFGNSCKHVFDITSYYNYTVDVNGILLHTKDLRYLYATAGRFYFVVYSKDKIKISQVSFTDSQYEKEVLCPSKI